MAEKDAKRREAIDGLIAERRKYEAWISQLETKRGETAEHVFTRVFEDYSTRLSDVRRRLTAEADNIRGLVNDLEERLADEQRAMTDRTDERAELELRATVGEFTPDEWADTKKSLDSGIEKIRKRFDATERDLAEMRELFDNVTAPTPAVPVGAVSSDEAPPLTDTVADLVPPALESEAPVDEVAAEPVAEPVAEPAALPEPEPLHVVDEVPPEPEPEPEPVVEPEPVKAAEPVAPPPPPPPTPAKRGSTPFDDLAFLKTIAGTPTGAKGLPAVPAEPGVRKSSRAELPDLPPSPLGAPTPRTSQAIRTLKCQECGTLNFPTEWYCEKCGGELAAF